MDQSVSPEELNQRIGTLKRFREMLQAQRDRFGEYLAVLDKQQDVIARGDTQALLSYVDMEEQILRDISSIQRVIDPLDRLCRDLAPSGEPEDTDTHAGEEAELRGLKATVDRLKQEAAANAERNRNLLSRRMAEIRSEIKSLRGNPYAARRSVYADSGAPQMIDIKG
jgi:hypothetical protein